MTKSFKKIEIQESDKGFLISPLLQRCKTPTPNVILNPIGETNETIAVKPFQLVDVSTQRKTLVNTSHTPR